MAISDRGFASMDPERQREIARMGGKASGARRSANNRKQGAAGRTEAARRGGQNSSRSR
jgi:general stress protein YciG